MSERRGSAARPGILPIFPLTVVLLLGLAFTALAIFDFATQKKAA